MVERGEMLEHHALLIKNLAEHKVDPEHKQEVEAMIKTFKATDYPEKIPEKQRRLEAKLACAVFGHMCPVYFVSEGFSEETWIAARKSAAAKSLKAHAPLKIAQGMYQTSGAEIRERWRK
jgi:hypothetical protein